LLFGASAVLTEELMREVRRLQVRTKRRVEGLFAGEYHSAFKGRGIEFAEVREYEAGDDVRAIDWNVTARTGKPFIKRFIEERELTVMLAVDLSRSGAFGSGGKSKARVIAELAAVLALAAVQNNDRVGLMVFTDTVELFLPARKGRMHVLRVLRELLNFEPAGRGTDIAGAVEHLGRVLSKRSVVFLISDFLVAGGASDGERAARVADMERALRVAGRKHELIAVTVTDPREMRLPAGGGGLVEIEDAETGERVVMDAGSRRARERFAAVAREDDAALGRSLSRARVDRIAVTTDKPFVPELVRYFKLKERRR
jgi:uncharacterized protein (DUF58 family)